MDEKNKLLKKLASYCSKKEVCVFDIMQKLASTQLNEDEKVSIINFLIKEKFIDEKRYAESFVNEKLNINGWGRIKIAEALKLKNIDENIINLAIRNIDMNYYIDIIKKAALKKINALINDDIEIKRNKVIQFLISKGFEEEIAENVISELNFNDTCF